MTTSRSTFLSTALIVVGSMAVGMVIASRFNMAPASSAQAVQAPAMNSAPITGDLTATTFRDIADAQTEMVVTLWTAQPRPDIDPDDLFGDQNDFFRRFFGQPGPNPEPRPDNGEPTRTAPTGTGFVIDRDGLILTNNHVVENATKIEIDFYSDGVCRPGDRGCDRYEARVLGRDPLTDSALLELVDKPDWELPAAQFGDSGQMAPGDWVMAIGAPFGYGHTVTVGVISALGRGLQPVRGRDLEMLQTDAAINPGNSGGPLLNIRGEVVGMNTAIVSDRRSNVGIGFAVPINTVRELLGELRGGKVTRGVIGVTIGDVQPEDYEVLGLPEHGGISVGAVSRGGPADQAGIEPGDVIVRFDGEPVGETRELQNRVVATAPGTTLPIEIVRAGEPMTLDVTIGELDPDAESQTVFADGEEEVNEGFGITLQDLTPELVRQLRLPAGTEGALVRDIARGSTAQVSGLQMGDVILRVNRVDVGSASEATAELNAIESGRNAFLLVQRGGTRVFIQVEKN